MPKDIKNAYEVLNMNTLTIEELNELLESGKTLLLALEKGPHVEKSLRTQYSEFLKARVLFKEEKPNCGTCGCGRPANILVYAWR